MSKSKAELSITKRLLLDFIKYKTNNNHTFFMGNDKIAAALGLTVNSAKVMVNELIREGYLLKSTDIHGRRVLNLSGKTYLTISCVDLSNIDKRILAQEVLNYQRDAEYYKQQYELEKARADRLAEEIGKIKLKQ
ncbi:MAG: hypothetical protein V8R23_09105 [Alphaproteobacteria bacterium]